MGQMATRSNVRHYRRLLYYEREGTFCERSARPNDDPLIGVTRVGIIPKGSAPLFALVKFVTPDLRVIVRPVVP